MNEIKTRRPYQERFLDGFDRSELRQRVQKIKPRSSFGGLRKKTASWALGASLAFGGLGVPLKIIQSAGGSRQPGSPAAATMRDAGIQKDLAQAARIAGTVAGGVQAVASGVEAATTAPLQNVAEAPQKITENVKKQFFKKEIPFGELIYTEAKRNNVRPELVAAVAHTESKFNPNARSQAGAVGLMQLVPRTGKWMGAKDLRNPVQNISAGAKYLAYLSDRFDGDERKILAAYNAGEGNVRRFGGVPPFRETRNYLTRVQSFENDLTERLDSHIQQIAMAR